MVINPEFIRVRVRLAQARDRLVKLQAVAHTSRATLKALASVAALEATLEGLEAEAYRNTHPDAFNDDAEQGA